MRSLTFIRRLTPIAVAVLATGGANAQSNPASTVSLYGVVDACVVSHRSERGAL